MTINGYCIKHQTSVYQFHKVKFKDRCLLDHVPKDCRPRAISSVNGKIKELIMVYPLYNKAERSPIDIFLRLVDNMPHAKFVLVCFDPGPDYKLYRKELGMLEKALGQIDKDYEKFIVDAYQQEISPWIKDLFYPIRYCCIDGLMKLVINNRNQGRDTHIIQTLKQQREAWAGVPFDPVDHNIEGGNILIVDNVCFMGGDVLSSPVEEAKFELDRISNILGIPEIVTISTAPSQYRILPVQTSNNNVLHKLNEVNGQRQPIFHIDLFLTIMGSDDNTVSLLLGNPVIHPTDAERAPDSVKQYVEDTKQILDCIAMELGNLKLHNGKTISVTRNPLPLTFHSKIIKNRRYGSEPKELLTWYWCSYNNALVEIDNNDGTRIYYPCYGKGNEKPHLSTYDNEFFCIAKSLIPNEYNIVSMPDFHVYAKKNGALHCIVNYTNRIDFINH